MNRLSMALAFVLATPLLACTGVPASSDSKTSSTSGAMTVHGPLARTSRALDNARAIAIEADGHVFSPYLDKQGHFTLKPQVGHAYRLSFGKSRRHGHE